jgi:hypothetical protein
MRSTWEDREEPILLAVWRYDEQGETEIGLAEIAEAAGLDPQLTRRVARALVEEGYMDGASVSLLGGGYELRAPRLRERGRVAIGQWPTQDGYEALLQAVDERIAATSDPAEKTRLERFRAAAGDVGKNVVGALLTAALRGYAGLD